MALEGRLVVLREERKEDQKLFTELRNDLETQGWNTALPPTYTESMYLKRFDAMEFSYERESARFSVDRKESGELAGYITYSDLEERLGATIGIAIAKPFWGTGVAFDAQEVLLRFLFLELGLRVVHLWSHSGNARALGLAEKAGFRITGRVREGMYKNGKLLDTIVMSVLREEYFALHPELEDLLPDPIDPAAATR
ncbi:GNAT family N-acetyltransferase [Candidatus Bipolaricaulota bacterium]